MTQVARKLYTPEEYLALEEVAEYKSEYYRGEIFAMAGGGSNHSIIGVNITTALDIALDNRPCLVYNSDMRIRVNDNGLYTYPDASALCAEPAFVEGRNDTITNPVVIAEVMSESTRYYDRHGKFQLYRALPTFEDYLLIEQNERLVEYYHRLNLDEWHLKIYSDPQAIIYVQSLDIEITMQRIYNRVIFPPSPVQNGHLNLAGSEIDESN